MLLEAPPLPFLISMLYEGNGSVEPNEMIKFSGEKIMQWNRLTLAVCFIFTAALSAADFEIKPVVSGKFLVVRLGPTESQILFGWLDKVEKLHRFDNNSSEPCLQVFRSQPSVFAFNYGEETAGISISFDILKKTALIVRNKAADEKYTTAQEKRDFLGNMISCINKEMKKGPISPSQKDG